MADVNFQMPIAITCDGVVLAIQVYDPFFNLHLASGSVVSDTGSGILDVTLPDGSGNGRTQHGSVCRA